MAMCKRVCVFAVPCMLSVGLQAEANSDTEVWGIPFIEAALSKKLMKQYCRSKISLINTTSLPLLV